MQTFNQQIKIDEEEKRVNKEKQHVRMVTVQKIIKQYNKYNEALKIREE